MSYKLHYWEHAVIAQPEDGQTVLAEFKGGDIKTFTYEEVLKGWFIRNISKWQVETTFTYEQLSKAQDFVSDCYSGYDCEKDRHKTGSCRTCNAKEILDNATDPNIHATPIYTKVEAKSAMDEYAKCIYDKFLEWVDGRFVRIESNLWIATGPIEESKRTRVNNDQLYNIFISEMNKI